MARSKGAPVIPSRDVLPRYMAMGTWKSKIIDKKGKASRTTSSPATIYVAVPPATGWPGGDPRLNGLGAKGKK